MEPKPLKELIKEAGKLPVKIEDLDAQARKLERKEFLDIWKRSDIAQRADLVTIQLRGFTKTAESVNLAGRVKIKEDPETFAYLMDLFYRDYGLDVREGLRHSELILGEFPDITIQDMELFFKKFRLGMYGKLYGKMTFGLMMQYFDNFQKSVGYNLALKREAFHKNLKEAEAHRDEAAWFENNRPEDLE
jgi:hypothetical protein